MGRFETPVSICAWVWGSLLGTTATVLFLIFGILALVPGHPFDERRLGLGVALVVVGGSGLAALAGTLIGVLVGAILGLPFAACSSYV